MIGIKKLLLNLSLITIFTAANIIFIYWDEPIQWIILIIFSSSIAGVMMEGLMKTQIKIILIAWIISMITTIALMCYPLLLWESDVVKVNEAIIMTAEKLIFITLIGIIVSMVSSIFFSLISER